VLLRLVVVTRQGEDRCTATITIMNLPAFSNSLIGALWMDVFRRLKLQGCRHH
jgi:hypothetical protein